MIHGLYITLCVQHPQSSHHLILFHFQDFSNSHTEFPLKSFICTFHFLKNKLLYVCKYIQASTSEGQTVHSLAPLGLRVRKGAQVRAHVVKMAPASHQDFPSPESHPQQQHSDSKTEQNLTLTMTSLVTVSILTGVILIAALKFLRKLHLCNAKTGYIQLVQVHITIQTENSYSISPHKASVKPHTIIPKYYFSAKEEFTNIQIPTRSFIATISVKRKIL